MRSRIIYELGEMRYELVSEWLKIPASLPQAMPVSAVAAAADGCLYILTRNPEHPVMSFDPQGRYMETLGRDLEFGNTHGLYVSRDDCLYLCDSARHAVYKISRKGEVLLRLGTLDQPCDNGFDPEVPYPYCLFTIRCAGAPFNRPTGAAEAPDGSIWCCDGYGNAAIHHFSREGKWLSTFGGPGREPGHFVNPHSIWVDQAGLIWVCDRDNHRVQVFEQDGTLRRCMPPVYPVDSPYGPSTLWSDGRLMFASCDTRGISIYDTETLEMAGLLEAPNGNPILGHSLCGDREGNLYIGHLNPKPMVTKMKKIS